MFTDLPILADTFDGHLFTIRRIFQYITKDGVSLIVPVGTTTDGASIPKSFWDILPPFGLYWPATVLHDYLYRNADGLHSHLMRKDCDDILLQAMIDLGVGLVTRTTIYEGVRLGGTWSFEADRRTIIMEEQVQHRAILMKMAYRVVPANLPNGTQN